MLVMSLAVQAAIVATCSTVGGVVGYKATMHQLLKKKKVADAEQQRLRSLGLIRDTPKPKPVKTETEA